MPDGAYSMLLPLIGIIILIFLAYYAASWIAKRYRGKIKEGRYIKVLERAMLGQEKSLVLVELNGKTYFISVTGQRIEVIDTLPADSLPEIETFDVKDDISSLLKILMQKQQWLKEKLKKKDESLPGIQNVDKKNDFSSLLKTVMQKQLNDKPINKEESQDEDKP